MTNDPPREPPGGQEDEPPDMDLLLTVVLVLLSDLGDYLDGRGGIPPDELRPRIKAVSAVVRRIREGRERDRR